MANAQGKMEDEGQKYRIIPNTPKDFVPAIMLDCVDNTYADRNYTITCQTVEFSAVCPKTGQPDLYQLSISYCPGAKIVELKSLKLMLGCYRNVGMFVENIANHILDLFSEAVGPKYLVVKIAQAVRGGIETIVTVTKGTIPDDDKPEQKNDFDTM